jgi:hypothetical protein
LALAAHHYRQAQQVVDEIDAQKLDVALAGGHRGSTAFGQLDLVQHSDGKRFRFFIAAWLPGAGDFGDAGPGQSSSFEKRDILLRSHWRTPNSDSLLVSVVSHCDLLRQYR